MDDSDDHQHDADDRIKKGSAGPLVGRSAHSVGGEPFRRIEILTGTARRKTWPKEFKARVITETFEPGANISAIARRHGVSIGLVHYWRKCARDGGFSDAPGYAPRFIPVVPSEVRPLAATEQRPDGVITIEVRGAMVRLEGAVDAVNLGKVLSALRSQF
jgi:transposase